MRARREALLVDGPPPGSDWCAAWTAVVDAACATLWAATPSPERVTVVAVGGYGRSELCPASDVDLLLLHDGLDRDELEALARAVFHPLWDARLQLGHAVRAADELVGDALADLDTTTAVLDGRVVAGDPARFDRPHDALLDRLRRRPVDFLGRLAAADADRRRRAGDAAEQLEPNVKSGAGGLRDVQSLRWAAAAVGGAVDLDALVGAGHVGSGDPGRLLAAEEELLALRVALHLEAGGRPGDVLRMELQQAVAERLGEVDGADDRDTAAHRALARHFAAARTIDHAHDRAWRQLTATGRRWGFPRRRPRVEEHDGLEVVDGLVRLPPDADPLAADLPARLVRVLVAGDRVLDRATADRLRGVADRVAVPTPWPDGLREAWLAMLRSPRGPRVQAELDDVGWLVALVPEWAPQRCRPQRNPFHRYSLDRHLVHAAEELALLLDADAPWVAAAVADLDLPDALVVGTWLHDVGKTVGEPHSRTGVGPARAVAERLGLRPAEVDRVADLVRLHLLLPEAGTRRDVSDPAEARAVAEVVGSRGLLASLHLLSAADGTATGPTAWTPWKASLVAVLVTKVRAVLDDHDPAALADGAAGTTDAALALAPTLGVDPDAVRAHLQQLPRRYAAAVSPRAVVRHAGLATPPPGAGEVRTRVTRTDVDGDRGTYDELDVVARDSPGLFARVAGVVALHGGSVLEAHAHTRADGVAVDTLTVVVPDHAPGSWWVTVEGDLAEAVAGRLAVGARVARRRRGEQRRLARLPAVATTVQTSRDAAGVATLVQVRTLDRIGVLHRIAQALAELELDMVVAKVATEGHEAVDVFSVRDAAGRPLDDDLAQELELAIGAALDE